VSNATGAGATSGTVTVTEAVPTGLTALGGAAPVAATRARGATCWRREPVIRQSR
jgi:hypothetical protein